MINITAGDESFNLTDGCEVTVSQIYIKIKPTEIYWLKNGKIKTFQNATQLKKLFHGFGEVTYKFQNPTRQSVFEEQGIYQCVVDFEGLDGPIIGRTFNVNIKGMQFFRILLLIITKLGFFDIIAICRIFKKMICDLYKVKSGTHFNAAQGFLNELKVSNLNQTNLLK